jgi:hypothetical protein
VGSAPQFEVPGVGRAAGRKRHHVVEFEEPGLSAMPGRSDEGASSAIASPDRALDGSRHVPRRRGGSPATPGPRCGAEFRSFQLFDQDGERALDDRSGIPGGNLVSQECPGLLEFVARALT